MTDVPYVPPRRPEQRDRELPLFWLPGMRNFHYATEKRDTEIAQSAVHENDPRGKNPRVRPFLWERRSAIAGGRPHPPPYYEGPAQYDSNVHPAPSRKFKNADQQRDWDTYCKYNYTRQVRQLARRQDRPHRQIAPRRSEYTGAILGRNEDQEDCVSQRTVICPVCGQEIQERFFESHGKTCWPLIIEYPQEPAAAIQQPPMGTWHEAQGTMYASQ